MRHRSVVVAAATTVLAVTLANHGGCAQVDSPGRRASTAPSATSRATPSEARASQLAMPTANAANAAGAVGDAGAVRVPAVSADGRAPGFRVRVFDVGQPMDRLYALAPDQTPNFEAIVPALALRTPDGFGGLTGNFRTEVTATLRVRRAGLHRFRLRSDDGGILSVDGAAVISRDGLHGDEPRDGEVELAEGDHPLRIDHFQGGSGCTLALEWQPPDAPGFVPLGGEDVWVDATLTPVVSPGRKRLLRDLALVRPGDTMPVAGVHPSWRVSTLHPPEFAPKVSALAFSPAGELLVTTFEPPQGDALDSADAPSGVVYVFTPDPNGDPRFHTYRRVADGLREPQGMCFVGERLFVTQAQEVTELIDENRDGFYETHRTLASGWRADNYHHFTFCLVHRDGALYTALSTAIAGPAQLAAMQVKGEVIGIDGPNPPHRGSVVKIDLASGKVDYIAGGLRTPNGLGLGPEGELFCTDNQGAWLPANKLIHIQPGHFYGHYLPTVPYKNMPEGGAPSPFQDQPVSPPALWLPYGEVSNSPTQFAMIPSGPFAGQMYVGELTQGGVRRAFLEKVNGQWQGCAMQFTQGLEAGVNRVVWGPDGALYLGMIGRGPEGNWNWRQTIAGLQKLEPTGAPTFELHSMSITDDGFEVRFTEPVDPAWLADVRHYRLVAHTYLATPDYGGPKVDEHALRATAARPAADGRSVRLVVPGRRAGYVVTLRTDPTSTAGQRMWATEAWYTVNQIPGTPTAGR